LDAETREEIDGLLALVGGLHQIASDAMTILKDVAPNEFEAILRTRRLLVQSAEQGTFQLQGEIALRAHRHARDLLEQVAEKTD